eukprot:UN01639
MGQIGTLWTKIANVDDDSHGDSDSDSSNSAKTVNKKRELSRMNKLNSQINFPTSAKKDKDNRDQKPSKEENNDHVEEMDVENKTAIEERKEMSDDDGKTDEIKNR